MYQDDLMILLQLDLNILHPDENRAKQLEHLIEAAVAMINREVGKNGGRLVEPYSTEDAQLVVMYASYLYRKRSTNEPMPRMLRYALNNRVFGGAHT